MADIRLTLSGNSTSAVPVDSTLTMNGAAADAAAVGARFTEQATTITAAQTAAEQASADAAAMRQFVEDTVADMLLNVYPVGSVYMNLHYQDPAALFGGVWEQMPETFLVGATGLVDSPFHEGTTGGALTHTHVTEGTALSVDQMPAHTHGTATIGAEVDLGANVAKHSSAATTALLAAPASVTIDGQTVNNAAAVKATSGAGYYVTGTKIASYTGKRGFTLNATHAHESAGNGAPHAHDVQEASNLPPYTAVYMWRRVS